MQPIRKILIASDAWHPQVNGVVRTLETTVQHLERAGCSVKVVEPGLFTSYPCPVYPEIRIAWPWRYQVAGHIEEFAPDAIHIATEAPIGYSVRQYCVSRNLGFTTSYHTKFPEYLQRMLWVPASLCYAYLRWFHGPATRVLVATESVEKELRDRGFRPEMVRWSRGVNLDLFHPRPRTFPEGHRPIQMYVGRVSTEKGLDEFLRLKLPGTKYVVGDGPARAALQRRFPEAVFLGKLRGEELATAYANADVFVFPSKTDTFGLVILEALASGVPVAAYPAPGPIDILTDPNAGALDPDLGRAIELALMRGRRDACLALARQYTWERCTRQFRDGLTPLHAVRGRDQSRRDHSPITLRSTRLGRWPSNSP